MRDITKFKQRELVFVYGTLRSGHHNHSLIRKSRKIGLGKTKEKYALYHTSIPFLYEDEKIHQVIGELYEVNSATKEDLDMLEGHPVFYRRKRVPVLVDDKQYTAWLYFGAKQGRLIESGDYEKK